MQMTGCRIAGKMERPDEKQKREGAVETCSKSSSAVVTADKAEQSALAWRQAVHERCVFAEPDDATGKIAAPLLRHEEM